MLVSLSIENFILIESATIPLGNGLTVITGETGAGKSMVIQALMFGMGERADASIIRHGCDEARVTLRFVTTSGDLVCDRRFMRNGKSRVTLNGASSSVTELRQLMSGMIDIVSQFDQQRLLNPESHLDVIDNFAKCDDAIASYTATYSNWQTARNALATRERQLAEARSQEEFLRYQRDELQKANLKLGEEDQLVADRDHVRHRAQWESRLQKLNELVSGDAGLERTLSQIAQIFPPPLMGGGQGEGESLVQQLQVLTAELSNVVAREVDTLSNAPADLDAVESRLFTLQQLSRKYKTDADGLIAKRDALSDQLKLLDLGDEGIEELRVACAACEVTLLSAGQKLTQLRRAVVKPLTTGIQKVLAKVGMPHATLHFQWRTLPIAEATSRGLDAVEFLISTNTGEPLLPMAQIASGGELSRILLAIQCVVTQSPSLQVFVFDEVDTGVSGRVASAVGSVLQRLAATTQVVCITHLPQVAVFGASHLQVEKGETQGRTHTRIVPVPAAARREAIAKLLSGSTLTETALHHADELLTQAHHDP